ncbi:sirohydrochlorin chelatase [Larsenimonas suaedae]|uniref:CbiX/SirB N-terminal domain-containing protein n=1 Tax=Larsenimonas suaedae TaxID=1851019 RepID=A0ABU1GZB6_9GAMM|nr:CbiX/SirB N-terminal domain-containing protein [Larsenimonas suaedae]MCM2973676.1 CbiX/SirB N-terminal domain-containing protein [Larsenimonas suaedae]MDR5897190.1 CbiX/SirB N-terminal domain-containing protein [Larsenimonas suaedae]
MKTAYVLMAHGSPDTQWQQPFQELEAHLKQRAEARVEMAYMELCDPLLEDTIANLDKEGFERIDILPLFFAVGRHLRKDVPAQIEAMSERHPGLSIQLMPPVGQHPAFTDALIRIIEEGIGGQNVD